MKAIYSIAVVGAVTIAGAGFLLLRPAANEIDTAMGKALYYANCAACHGAGLKGQPDWQTPGPDGILPAPPHDETGHTWHHEPDLLFAYTKFGGAEAMRQRSVDMPSGMPGFGDTLSDDQIRAVLGYIESTWPEEIRNARAQRFGG